MYLNLILAFYLILALPAEQLWKSLNKKNVTSKSRRQRYAKLIFAILIPLGALFASFCLSWISAEALGLDMPVSLPGKWGLAVALLLLVGLGVGGPMWERKLDVEKRAEYLAQLKSNEIMPRTRTELWTFMLLTLFVGVGWELLYRGFLLFVLSPFFGTAGAVIISALAYGLAHGYENPKQLTGSIISAFVFTIGFVLTASLWWLMLVHVGLPLLGAISCYMALKAEAKVDTVPALNEGQPNI